MEPTNPQPVPAAVPPPRPGWWSRNWKWFVPMGCLTFIGIFVAVILLLFVVIFGAMRSSDVYKEAVSRARANPEVTEAMGAPLKEGFFVSGTTNVSGGTGDANLEISISGPKGSGKIYAVAEKAAGQWTYSRLEVVTNGSNQRINLRADTPESE